MRIRLLSRMLQQGAVYVILDGQRFEATLERGDRALGWTVARVPFEPHALWPAMIRLRVAGEVSGPAGSVPFRTSMFPRPEAERQGYVLLINGSLQRRAGLSLGARAGFLLGPDLAPRPADLPEELDTLLDEDDALRKWYGELSEYTRREIGKWVSGVKRDDARLRRARQMAERLMSAMEAEIAFPPLMARAFQLHPRALLGWQRMTVAQRRTELMAVFYYQTPEARQRRLNKLVQAAEARAVSSRSDLG